jgi:hypothetical protein
VGSGKWQVASGKWQVPEFCSALPKQHEGLQLEHEAQRCIEELTLGSVFTDFNPKQSTGARCNNLQRSAYSSALGNSLALHRTQRWDDVDWEYAYSMTRFYRIVMVGEAETRSLIDPQAADF